jgi:hypothetical protein
VHDNNNDHVSHGKKNDAGKSKSNIHLSPIRQTGIKFDYQNFIIDGKIEPNNDCTD